VLVAGSHIATNYSLLFEVKYCINLLVMTFQIASNVHSMSGSSQMLNKVEFTRY